MTTEKWPGTIEVHVETLPKPSDRVTSWRLALFALLLVAFTGYGMVRPGSEILSSVFELVRYGIVWILGWAFGRQHMPP